MAAHLIVLFAALALCMLQFETASAVLVSASVLCLVLARVESIIDVDQDQTDAVLQARRAAEDTLLTVSRRQALLASMMTRTAKLDATARDAWFARCADLAARLDTPGPDIDRALHALRDEVA